MTRTLLDSRFAFEHRYFKTFVYVVILYCVLSNQLFVSLAAESYDVMMKWRGGVIPRTFRSIYDLLQRLKKQTVDMFLDLKEESAIY